VCCSPTQNRFSTIVALLLITTGCTYLEGSIGQLSAESLTVQGCLDNEKFDISLNALAIDACADLLYIRAQVARTPVATADGIIIQLAGLAQLQKELENGPVEMDIGPPNVTLTLILNDTCPDSFASLEATSGTLMVTALETSTAGDLRLSGTATITDTKEGKMASPSLTIEIDASDSSYLPMLDYPRCP
jgi:hypothetical protein